MSSFLVTRFLQVFLKNPRDSSSLPCFGLHTSLAFSLDLFGIQAISSPSLCGLGWGSFTQPCVQILFHAVSFRSFYAVFWLKVPKVAPPALVFLQPLPPLPLLFPVFALPMVSGVLVSFLWFGLFTYPLCLAPSDLTNWMVAVSCCWFSRNCLSVLCGCCSVAAVFWQLCLAMHLLGSSFWVALINMVWGGSLWLWLDIFLRSL